MLMFLITLGYLAVSLFLHENHELNMLLVNTLQRVRRRKGRVGREERKVVQKRKSKERLVYAFSPSPHLSGPEELQHDGGFNGSNHHLQADRL